MDLACSTCGTPYGKRQRCYRCTGRKRTGVMQRCEWCGQEKYFQKNQMAHGEGRYCSRRCKYAAMQGKAFRQPLRPRRSFGEKRVNQEGYVQVKISRDGHEIWEYEHRLVAAQILGRSLARGDVVHHINHDRADNGPENLRIFTRGEHQRHHAASRPRTDVIKQCEYCAQSYRVRPSMARTSRYCSREHHRLSQPTRAMKQCECCGADYRPKHSHVDQSRFCSRACQLIAARSHKHGSAAK
jgi:hypothetical protein